MTCSGTHCNGQDPEVTGCAERTGTSERVEIVDRQGLVVGWLELRWSRICETNWARVGNTSSQQNLELQAYLRDEQDEILTPTLKQSRTNGVYGNMWYAPTGKIYVKACGIIGPHEEVCTNLH